MMSETNLILPNYPLDIRDLRLSLQSRAKFQGSGFDITPDGIIDITEFSQLDLLSDFLQKDREEEEKFIVSNGNINLYALNTRIRLNVLASISNILETNLFEDVENLWEKEGQENKNTLYNEFSEAFLEDGGDPTIDQVLRYWFSKRNPAHQPYSKIFYTGDGTLVSHLAKFENVLESFRGRLPTIDEGDIFTFLKTPETKYPTSIRDQIQFIIDNWAKYLDPTDLKFLLLGIDLIEEEEKFRGFGEPGPAEVYEFGAGFSRASFYGDQADEIRFSPDQDWMPSLVLLSKNIIVWLDQLSKKYQREIRTLSDIPDEELDHLADLGFTGLWLVGMWQRSPASKKIKNIAGNEAAIASAYSIYDYDISEELGGDQGYRDLKERLAKRGIKIGADMVPNHMGIDSKWVRENPHWFIHTHEKPFQSYSYSGDDLCDNPDISIYLEDHYYDQSDAAVTFKRVDNNTGETHFIYHGNDGTSFPWNDTAQLDFLNEEVRETVISTIVGVAQKFPIIRFDAAMVLAKQHIRRLWYPAPGEGGDIPSRSRFSMSDEEFQDAIPKEFWREVVDRVNEDAPDTLLLAEAFWLLEGYFVRTLGMHRVYNSAFMKMLSDEENAKYRQTIKNVLEYDPEILKRFVNYLTTPDEEPAISQFGTGDKYFGLVTMMATMPGLPMFGHGQIEGLSEKYGMEFARAQYDEQINDELVSRHRREIVPLLKRRYLFSGSENFYLYDFFRSDGSVNENVFAYSNRYSGEKALVIYNNRYEEAVGWVKRSVAYSEKLDDKTTRLRQVDLFEGLDLSNGDGYLLFRDHVSGLEYIRSKDEIREKGLFVSVGAFKYHVFVDLKEVSDSDGIWAEVTGELKGEGTENLQAMYDQYNRSSIISHGEYAEAKEDVGAGETASDDQATSFDDSLESELEELHKENQKLLDELSLMSDQNQNLKAELRETKAALDKSRNKLSSQSVLLEEQNRKISELQRTNASMSVKVKDLEMSNKQLSQSVSEIQSSSDTQDIIRSLESKLQDLKDANNVLETELQEVKADLAEKVQNIDALATENESLQTRLVQSRSRTAGSYKETQETLLSSVLLESIATRLEDSPSGIHLRNLAMSLGISMKVCLNHVKTMEKKGQASIRYRRDDDSNPIISAKQ